jgi:hypothetical protein
MLVVQGCYTVIYGEERIVLQAGDEYVFPRDVEFGGEVVAGTRTIHMFAGHRAERE